MKRNILHTLVLFGAVAFASCSTTNKVASTKIDDDVYYSKAESGDAPEYRQPITQDRYVGTDDDDYYYYDSYASRINRFGYAAPFNYYDDYYYGYSSPYLYNGVYPYSYYSPYSYGLYGGIGVGLGFGYGGGYGYPYMGYGYGYGYSPYSYWGTGLGWGGPYWGVYSAYSSRPSNPRPYRGSGFPNSGMTPRTSTTGYNGAYPNSMNYPGRSSSARPSYSGSSVSGSRPDRSTVQQPTYRPQREEISRPSYQPSNNSGSSYSGGSSSGGGSSHGGGRPSRP